MMMICRCRSTAANAMYQPIKLRSFSSIVVRNTAAVRVGPQHNLSLTSSPSIESRNCGCRHPRTCHHHHRLYCRNMSSNSSNSMEPDWVRSAIQKMILDQQQPENGCETSSTSTPSTTPLDKNTLPGTPNSLAMFDNPDLEKSLQSLQNQLHEAELCIQDCYECASSSSSTTDQNDMLRKEIDAADHSIDVAVAHFVDLLDAKQEQSSNSSSSNGTSLSPSMNHGGNDSHSNAIHKAIPTEDLVKRIKHLRAEIAKLKLVQQQSIVTDPKNAD